MIILPPTALNINSTSTDIKPKTVDITPVYSTRLLNDENEMSNLLNNAVFEKKIRISTIIEIDDKISNEYTTWSDIVDFDEFIFKFQFKKKIGVNATIKTISKFIPKIVID